MTTEPLTPNAPSSEVGLLIAVLVMVVLGAGAMLLMS